MTSPGAAASGFDSADRALAALLGILAARGYRFITPTPATQARIFARNDRRVAAGIEDVLGWSLPFARGDIDPAILAALDAGGILVPAGAGLFRATLRVSTLDDCLFLHSAYPTEAGDAVFFGPDSYRFADRIAAELDRAPLPPGARILDIGAGAGVGAIVAARRCDGAAMTLTDINPEANRLARINAYAANIAARWIEDATPPAGPFDFIVANPPYMVDDAERDYRNGGDMHGGEAAVQMTRDALPRLAPGGRFLLYTGSAIVRGQDALDTALRALASANGCALRYREIDPDVFGEELAKPAYRDVDRIAVVKAIFTRRP